MKLDSLFAQKKCPFALEVFPPKQQSGIDAVYAMLQRLEDVPADYISVTYSAGGSGAKHYTADIARRLKESGTEPLAHLTCYGQSGTEIQNELARLRAAGVENILALRGDAVPGGAMHSDYAHASHLIEAIAADGGFYIVAACYPERHPESPSDAEDVRRLAEKISAGAGHLVSQLFFDNGRFFRFLNLCRKQGVHCPIEAGVMPIVKPEQIGRTVQLSSASLPSAFTRWASRYAASPQAFYDAGIDYAVRQIRDLIQGGADGIHLYAMNNPDVAARVYAGIADLLG